MGKRKVTITESELTDHFRTILFGEPECECEEKTTLKEDFTGSEKEQIRGIIRDFLKMSRSESFDASVKKMVKDYVKKDKELEKYFVEISKNVLVQLYKTLWTRRNFWTSDLKNSAN